MKVPIAPLAPATLALVLTLAPIAAQRGAPGSIPETGDEFVGPFPSWSRVTADYGATGDGVTDDTAAIQRALDELGRAGRAPVLFLPAGTYRITRTLSVGFAVFLSIVGEDPATTVLRWDGQAGGTMLVVNGLAYSRIVRLTFDGRRRAEVAVEQSWDGSAPHFDTGNEYADDRFVDVAYGIRGGFRDRGFAETSVVAFPLRSEHVSRHRARQLQRARSLGVALDVRGLRDRRDEHDRCGQLSRVQQHLRAILDGRPVHHQHGRLLGARQLLRGLARVFRLPGRDSEPRHDSPPGKRRRGHRRYRRDPPRQSGTRSAVDNTIQSLPGARGPVVTWEATFGADVTSIGNSFTVTNPIQSNGRVTSVDDRIMTRSQVRVNVPSQPDALPKLDRPVFEVPANGDGRAVQAAIDAASARRGTRPIVHVPAGAYAVSETLTIPASDLQLVGDGYGTILRWAGSGAGPVVRLRGPSRTTLREIQIDGNGRGDGLLMDDVDQPDGRVFLQQVQVRHARQADLVVDGLDFTHVQAEDFGHAYSPNGAAIRVSGGPRRSAGEATSGRVSIYSGASSGNRLSYDVSNGARLLVRDLWYESGVGAGFARVHGRAELTTDGLRVSSPVGGEPSAFAIDDLDGRVAILATHLDDGIKVAGAGNNANVLALALFCEQRLERCYQDVSRPPARGAVLNSRHPSLLPFVRSAPATNVGTADPDFLRAMLRHARDERPAGLTARPAHVTDVRMFRVLVQNGRENVRLTRMVP